MSDQNSENPLILNVRPDEYGRILNLANRCNRGFEFDEDEYRIGLSEILGGFVVLDLLANKGAQVKVIFDSSQWPKMKRLEGGKQPYFSALGIGPAMQRGEVWTPLEKSK
jgi:hypothetical protein